MRLVVLGDPIDHSLSPALHTAALAASGLEGEYGKRRVDADGMIQAVAEIRSGELSGASVTMPHKELAAQLADRLSTTAKRCGAVNTLVHANGVVGHNTDVAGIASAWAEAGLADDSPVLVVGAGGAAAAAMVALEGRQLHVAARRDEAAADLIATVGVAANVVEWESAMAGAVSEAVVVNATPIGMQGDSLPAALIESSAGLFDMAYGPAPTPAVVAVRAAGLPAADGPAMLLHQAAAAFALWTGRPAPLEAMRRALPN